MHPNTSSKVKLLNSFLSSLYFWNGYPCQGQKQTRKKNVRLVEAEVNNAVLMSEGCFLVKKTKQKKQHKTQEVNPCYFCCQTIRLVFPEGQMFRALPLRLRKVCPVKMYHPEYGCGIIYCCVPVF